MQGQDTSPSYDDLQRFDELLARVEEILSGRDAFAAFLADHPELDELDDIDPEFEEISACVERDFGRWWFRLRWHLADWLDRLLLP
jgi:hypothetical protein